MTGWRPLITATVRLANRNGIRLRRRAAEGRLLFEPAGAVPPPTAHRRRRHSVQPSDYVRGVLAGAWTLSAEICHDCGGPGDPVSGASGRRSTRCADCRAPGDQVLPRPAWRRQREPGEAGGLLENLAGTEDLAALMEARYTPTTHPGWPVRRAGGDPDGGALRVIGAAGWNHLLRAGFAALLPLECPGVAPPWRLMCAKERLGRLRVYNCHPTPFYEGIAAILSDVSATTCVYCGRPGRMRRPGWMHPACDRCQARGAERVWTWPLERDTRLRFLR